jgi:peptidoglycan/LPS O-acetylase OafA/YrhL
LQFRKDINGLRAIAVIAVVLFHFNASWMPGGFAGVDVFFVISGFLMTGLIFRGIEQENFSIFRFYVARANRIIPALAVLCLALLVFGWFYFLNAEYKALGEHAASSVGFLSNVIYWGESGYFDAASHEKWLLHTWSLSVEWQFYIIYPLVLVAMRKFMSVTMMKAAVLLGTIVGFIFCVVVTYKWPDPAYYLLPTRAWEMMMGGVAYLYPISLKESRRKLLEWFGLVLILGSYLLISKNSPWPGYLALFPVLGTFLIIQAQCNDSFITSNIVTQKIGAWSYSIYLWHWPLVVYMNTYIESNVVNIIILIGLSVFVGMLSNIYIEKKVKGVKALMLFLITSILAITVYMSQGNFDFRKQSQGPRNDLVERYDNYKMDPTGLFEKCNASIQIRDTGILKVSNECLSSRAGGVFLWGDSHMGALSTGLRHEIDSETPFSQLTSSGCAPSFLIKKDSSDRFGRGCDYSNGMAYDSILKIKPAVVILGARNNHENNDWYKTIDRLYRMGVQKVIVIGPFPQWKPSLPLVYVKRHFGEEFFDDPNFDGALVKSNDYLQDLANRKNDFIFINILSNLCNGRYPEKYECRARVGEALIIFDYGHLTVEGSRFIAREYVVPFL